MTLPFSVLSKVISGYFSFNLSEVCFLDAGLNVVTLVFNFLPVFSENLSSDIGGTLFVTDHLSLIFCFNSFTNAKAFFSSNGNQMLLASHYWQSHVLS